MFSKRHITSILCLIILTVGLASAKSLYVINDTDTSEMQAYKIEGSNLVHEADYVCKEYDPGSNMGAVGITIDESGYRKFLFITFESKNIIEMVHTSDNITKKYLTNSIKCYNMLINKVCSVFLWRSLI